MNRYFSKIAFAALSVIYLLEVDYSRITVYNCAAFALMAVWAVITALNVLKR